MTISYKLVISVFLFLPSFCHIAKAVEASRPTLSAQELPLEKMISLYSSKYKNVSLDTEMGHLNFSPSMKYLVFGGMNSGYFDSFWLYDIANSKLILATKILGEDKFKAWVHRMQWTGPDRLHLDVWLTRPGGGNDSTAIDVEDGRAKIGIAAKNQPGRDNSHQVNIGGSMAETDLPSGVKRFMGIDLKKYDSIFWASDGISFAGLVGPSHGFFQLKIGIADPKPRVVPVKEGSWELASVGFSPEGKFLAYSDMSTEGPSSLAFYELARQRVTRRVYVASPVTEIVWSKAGALAFVGRSCELHRLKSEIPKGVVYSTEKPPVICILNLKDKEVLALD